MTAILLKATHPSSFDNHPQFMLLTNEHEKDKFINQYRHQSKKVAKKTNQSQVFKLEFIYPDDYTETIVMKAE